MRAVKALMLDRRRRWFVIAATIGVLAVGTTLFVLSRDGDDPTIAQAVPTPSPTVSLNFGDPGGGDLGGIGDGGPVGGGSGY